MRIDDTFVNPTMNENQKLWVLYHKDFDYPIPFIIEVLEYLKTHSIRDAHFLMVKKRML